VIIDRKKITQGSDEMSRAGEMVLRVRMKVQSLLHGESGQDLVEYSLLVALIALACIAGVRHVATAVSTVFTNISNSLG
jgi:pilus assembly protein Flp/PilA